MKKNYVSSMTRYSFLFIILMSLTGKLIAQCDSCSTITVKPPLPHMYVESLPGKARRACFMNGTDATDGLSKYNLLSGHLGSKETDNIRCSINSLIDFICRLSPNITFLKFYIAAYDNSCNKCTIKVADSLDKHLMLIIAPSTGKCNKTAKDSGNYYFINENGIITQIPKECKEGFIKCYEGEKLMKVLYKTINNDPVDDHDQDNPGPFSDTKYVIYYLPYLKEFIDTEKCVQKKFYGVKLTGIEIDFCSFTKDGITLNDNKKHYKDRLSIQFNYLVQDSHGQYQPYEIPKDGRKPQRNSDKCLGVVVSKYDMKMGSGGDNGTLCPANCPH